MAKKSVIKKVLVMMLVTVFVLSSFAGCSTSTPNTSSNTSSTTAGSSNNAGTVSDTASSGAVFQWGDQAWADLVRKAVSGKTLKVGFSPPAASEFYDIIQHGAYTMMNEIESRFDVKIDLEFSAPSEHQAVESQVATIENWVSKKFDAILVCSAGDFDSMNAVYQKAMDNGTSIYMFNMPAEMWSEDQLKAVSVIGYNNHYQAGYVVGQYAAKKLNGQGKILLVWGLPGHWSTARKEGFMAAIKSYPGLQIVGEQRGDYVRDKGMTAAQNLLQAHPDANFIYGENEEMALGAVQAIEAAGLKFWDGQSGIITVGADGLSSGYESIREGKLTATISVGAVDQGREFIKAVFLHTLLGYNIDKIINVPTILVDKDNVEMIDAYANWALNTDHK